MVKTYRFNFKYYKFKSFSMPNLPVDFKMRKGFEFVIKSISNDF